MPFDKGNKQGVRFSSTYQPSRRRGIKTLQKEIRESVTQEFQNELPGMLEKISKMKNVMDQLKCWSIILPYTMPRLNAVAIEQRQSNELSLEEIERQLAQINVQLSEPQPTIEITEAEVIVDQGGNSAKGEGEKRGKG